MKQSSLIFSLFTLAMAFQLSCPPLAKAEEDYEEETVEEEVVQEQETPKAKPAPVKLKPVPKKKEARKYFTDNSPRSDAGIFHVAFALGGNVYVEPKLIATTKEFADDYFKDFGYQGGVYFDYDYSRTAENIPLALRGYLGYKYALNTTHIFALEGVVRRMFQLSENSDFGIGAGVSLATWFRTTAQVTNNETTQIEETILLPTFIVAAGFDFNPFMVDLKWMIHRFGQGNTIMGAEFNFGVRL
jgi:hypothetical protein